MKKWKENIVSSKPYKDTLQKLRKTKINRDRVPLLKVLQVLYAKLTETNVHQQASAIAFSFMLSLFPAILFLFSLLPFITSRLNMPDLSDKMLALLREGIPYGIYEFVAPTIRDILINPGVDLLSFGFLFAMYAATTGVVELMNTFNLNFAYSEKRSFVHRRLTAIGLAFLFAFLLIFAVVVIIIGEIMLHLLLEYRLLNADFLYYSIFLVRYLVTFLVFYIGISYVYYVAPAVSNQWRFFSLGSTIASVLAILSTNGFSFYLSNFANYNKLYGSIRTLIALMVWLYLLAWILLLGFALNASIREAWVAHEKEMRNRYNLLEDIEEDESISEKPTEPGDQKK